MNEVEIIEAAGTGAIAAWLDRHLSAAARKAAGRIAITIPGGSTPFPIIASLVELDPGPPWSAIEVWPNDDRIVPEDHAASNIGRMRALLEPAGAILCTLAQDREPPHFALTWLGMGTDGHTASLFPNIDPGLDDPLAIRRVTPDPLPADAPFDRITLTLPALLDTDAILLTLGGSTEKRALFDAALRGGNDLPITRVLRAAKARGIAVTCFA